MSVVRRREMGGEWTTADNIIMKDDKRRQSKGPLKIEVMCNAYFNE